MMDDERRILELLAASDDGTTDALLLEHGFPLKVILSIIGTKLATATPERVFAAGGAVDVSRLRVTDVGRRALAE